MYKYEEREGRIDEKELNKYDTGRSNEAEQQMCLTKACLLSHAGFIVSLYLKCTSLHKHMECSMVLVLLSWTDLTDANHFGEINVSVTRVRKI